MRYQFDSEYVAPKTEGYRLVAEKPGKAPFVFRVFNLSSKDLKRSIRLTFLHPEKFEWEDVQEATIPAQGHVDVHWNVDLAKAFAATGTLTARVSTVEEGSEADEFVEIDLSETQPSSKSSSGIPFNAAADRRHAGLAASHLGHGEMTMEADEDDGWRLKCQFQGGDRWVYPYFRLTEDVAVEQYSAIVLRARCSKKAAVRVFFWEGNTGVGYLSSVVIPSDGNWHTAVVPFDDLMISGANQPDPNHQLDLDQVRRISIGMNSESDDNTLEVSEPSSLRNSRPVRSGAARSRYLGRHSTACIRPPRSQYTVTVYLDSTFDGTQSRVCNPPLAAGAMSFLRDGGCIVFRAEASSLARVGLFHRLQEARPLASPSAS